MRASNVIAIIVCVAFVLGIFILRKKRDQDRAALHARSEELRKLVQEIVKEMEERKLAEAQRAFQQPADARRFPSLERKLEYQIRTVAPAPTAGKSDPDHP